MKVGILLFAYINCIIDKVLNGYIEAEVNQIGYMIKVPNPFIYEKNQEYKIYLYQHIREDCNDLYGFSSSEEKELFLKLISVNGIGPKSALAILASGKVLEIVNAIENGNANYLMRFPGIGPKASQQIILDLKGKIDLNSENSSNLDDVKEALLSLGYKQKEIEKVLTKIDINLKTDVQLKEALALLLGR